MAHFHALMVEEIGSEDAYLNFTIEKYVNQFKGEKANANFACLIFTK